VPPGLTAGPARWLPITMTEHILLRHRDIPDLNQLEVYLQHGGFEAFKKAVTTLTPQQVIDEIKASGLRGRGGAGFPTGVKWSLLTKDVFPRYVVANSDESEPGTFKDRELLHNNPYQFLEGLMIAAYAAQANLAFNYLRGEFADLAARLDANIAELRRRGLLGSNLFGTTYSLEVRNHLGAGAYICGEESALLESIEGQRGQPRPKPPFPADKGLYQKPTVINNAETLSNVPLIMARGAAWYRTFGTASSPGVKIFCLSGSVVRPGNYELPLGTTFRELIYTYGGGPTGGRKVKGFMPSGASSAILPGTDDILDCPMDYESVAQKGSGLGSASVIVFDETVDIVWLALKVARFFKHESCGKCTPCRVGLRLVLELLERVYQGEGEPEDLVQIEQLCATIVRGSLCGLGQAAPNGILSSLRHFRPEFEARVLTPSRS
jgi:NADH-quinone oxidoreductase subunit F